MSDLKVCRICLVMGVKMTDLNEYPIGNYLQSIIGTTAFIAGELPEFACYECSALILKYYLFRERCLQGQYTLFELLNKHQQLTAKEIEQTDRISLKLCSRLRSTTLSDENTYRFIYDEFEKVEIKFEPKGRSVADDEVESIKQESDDNGDVTLNSDSSDDEPLVICKMNLRSSNRYRKEIFKVEPTPRQPSNKLPKRELKKVKRNVKEAVKKKIPKKNGSAEDPLNLEQFVTTIQLSMEEQLEEVMNRKSSSNYLNSPFKCEYCYKGFIDSIAFKNHMRRHDPSSGDVECPICKFRFMSRRKLLKHNVNHEKKYACKTCPHISTTAPNARLHLKWHKGVTYKCHHCDEVSNKWTSHLSHMRIKHPSPFVCGSCGYSFVSQHGLNMHQKKMHGKDQDLTLPETMDQTGPYCKDCDVQFESIEAWKRHMVHSAKHALSADNSTCRACGESFPSMEEMRLHHRASHARKRPKNYGKKPRDDPTDHLLSSRKCRACDEEFKSVKELRVHQKTYHLQKRPRIYNKLLLNRVWPSKCEHCEEIIPNARENWVHFRRAHPDKEYPIQKSYICEICGKGFRGNAFLVYHKRTHFEERAYKCVQCPKAFYNRTNLQMHEKTHSDQRPYVCSVCFKAFKLKTALKRHIRRHTGVKPYSCEFCGKAFGQSNNLKLHVRTVHLKLPAPYMSRARHSRNNSDSLAHPV